MAVSGLLRWMVPALLTGMALAGGVTPELQQRVRGATFEVVLKKPATDPLSYEKPLPLELLPYIERTDAYRSIGTAFALGHNTYVTAGHVLVVGVASQYGAPALRGADGRVHAIDRILKYSAHEDFAVFSLTDDPDPPPLALDREPHVDDAVLAVGNALGEGIVIRDGLYTSDTAEEQDGRWKWIRFSAAASPGNSGGPLLDAAGRVIGIVIGKSPNENLNYSLPIGRVLDAAADSAAFDLRALQSLPFLRGTRTYSLKDGFALPKTWSEFAQAYSKVIDQHGDKARAELLAAYAATRFPQGKGVEELLYDVDAAYLPRLVVQDADDSWSADAPRYTRTELGGDGFISVGTTHGISLLRLHRPGNAADAAFYADSRGFMDLALKGLNITRPVGSDAVRVTSLGPALTDTRFVDHYGRRWQERTWPLPYLDAYVVGLLLPTPDGYVGLMQYTPSLTLPETRKRMQLLADLYYVSYWGTLQQWQAWLARRDSLPDALAQLKLQAKAGGWRFASPRLGIDLGPEVMRTDAGSMLGLQMAYLPEAGGAAWGIGAVAWYQDEAEKSYVVLGRQLRPPATASRALRDRWDDLIGRKSPYNGTPTRDDADAWTVRTVIDVPGGRPGTVADDLLYSLTVHTENRAQSQDVGEMKRQALLAVQVLEHGSGEQAAAAGAATLAGAASSAAAGEQTDQLDKWLAANEAYFAEIGDWGRALGKDIRGREFADDLRDYCWSASDRERARQLRDAIGTAAGAGRGGEAAERSVELERLVRQREARARALASYWSRAGELRRAHELWGAFLARNHLPADTPRSAQVLTLEQQLRDELSGGTADAAALDDVVTQLQKAYQDERRALHGRIRAGASLGAADFRQRTTACPAPVSDTAGGTHPVVVHANRGIDEYYPPQSRRDGETGTVVVAIRVDAGGCARAVAVLVSTGSERLDTAALSWIEESAEFSPATTNGKAIESVKELAVTFKLGQPDAPG